MLMPETRILKLSPRQEDTINQAVKVSVFRSLKIGGHMPMKRTKGTDMSSASSQREAITLPAEQSQTVNKVDGTVS
jgi:hypothetical protein